MLSYLDFYIRLRALLDCADRVQHQPWHWGYQSKSPVRRLTQPFAELTQYFPLSCCHSNKQSFSGRPTCPASFSFLLTPQPAAECRMSTLHSSYSRHICTCRTLANVLQVSTTGNDYYCHVKKWGWDKTINQWLVEFCWDRTDMWVHLKTLLYWLCYLRQRELPNGAWCFSNCHLNKLSHQCSSSKGQMQLFKEDPSRLKIVPPSAPEKLSRVAPGFYRSCESQMTSAQTSIVSVERGVS